MAEFPTLSAGALRRPLWWIRSAANPVLPNIPGDAFESHCCMNPFVVRRNDDYWLYYAGGDADGRRRICLSIAPVSDPTRWQRHGVVLDVGAPDAFDARWVVLPHVVLINGQWHLYYTANCGRGAGLSAFPGIGLAISDDGRHFERYGSDPILAPGGQPGDPDRIGIAGGSIIPVFAAGGVVEWRFYYTGCPTLGPNVFLDQQKTVCLAVSRDGIDWTKRGAVMTRLSDRSHVDIAAAGPVVWRDDDGLFRMVYSAIGTRWGYYSIAYAESDDGLSWRRGDRGGDDLTLGPHGDGWERQMVEYPAVIREGGRRRLFYCGNGYGGSGIGTALSAPLRALGTRGPSALRIVASEADAAWTLRFPEAVSCDEGVFKSWEAPILDWQGPTANGLLWQEWEMTDADVRAGQANANYRALDLTIIGGIGFRTVIEHVDDGLRLQFSVWNRSDRTFHNLIANPCLGMPACGFEDPDMEHTFIVTEGGLTPVRATDRGGGDPVRTIYPVRGAPPSRRTLDSFWGTPSATTAAEGIIVRSHDTGRWSIALAWPDAAMVWHNNDTHHRCIHAMPLLGDLPPGETRTATGRLVFLEASAAETWQYLKEQNA